VPSIPIVRLDRDLELPAYAKPGDAGIDLLSRIDVVIPPAGGRVLVPTGIAVALPVGHGGFLLPRSGLALKHGITLLNSPGLIDAGYRDEIKVLLVNTDPTNEYRVVRGDRVAQLVVLPVEPIRWLEVGSLDGENRGGGFGHTGR
jgi:dUTP pyrophosphatase